MPLSNNEKQIRFRKKELLKRIANDSFNDWILNHSKKDFRTPDEVKYHLEKIANLPSKWTDENYEEALCNIKSYCKEISSTEDYGLYKDIKKGIYLGNELKNQAAIDFYENLSKMSLRKMQQLSQIIISQIDLVGEFHDANAAMIMEIAKHIGRKISGNFVCGYNGNYAMALCLACLPEYYDRPRWFIEELSQCIKKNLGNELAKKLGKELLK